MAQKNVVFVTGAVIGALVGALVAAMGGLSFMTGSIMTVGSSDTDILLRLDGGNCTVTGKATEVVVGKGKTVTWNIKNYCEPDQTVTVGNVRTGAVSLATDCQNATDGTTWPFSGNDTNKRTATVKGTTDALKPGTGKIKLTDAANAGSKSVVYYFDICLGANGGTKVDPRLVIDP